MVHIQDIKLREDDINKMIDLLGILFRVHVMKAKMQKLT
jgi:hypothetical protein